jgi:hypothetical protein
MERPLTSRLIFDGTLERDRSGARGFTAANVSLDQMSYSATFVPTLERSASPALSAIKSSCAAIT